MRYAIVSDIHANIQAWDAVLKDIRKQGVDAILCLGDVIGYGPNPAEVLDSCYENVDYFILGNHDAVIGNRMSSDLFNDNAKYLIEWTRGQLNEASEKFFNEMPLMMEGSNFACAHAELAKPGRFSYLLNADDCRSSFEANKHQIMFVGHTHCPSKFIWRKNKLKMVRPGDFSLQPNDRYLVNVGSVGDPRDGLTTAHYCLYDEDKKFVINRQVPFDIQGFKSNLIKAAIPMHNYFISVAEGQAQETETLRDMKVLDVEHIRPVDKVHYVKEDTLNETRTRRMKIKVSFSQSGVKNLKKGRNAEKTLTRQRRSKKKKKSSSAPAIMIALLVAFVTGVAFISLNKEGTQSAAVIKRNVAVQQESVIVEENVELAPLISVVKSTQKPEETPQVKSAPLKSELKSISKPEATPKEEAGAQPIVDKDSFSVKLSQSTNAGQGVTSIDLTVHGDLDWAVWGGGNTTPKQTMAGGHGFRSFSAIGATTFKTGSFYGQNHYSWTNGSPSVSGSSSLAGSASAVAEGDGIRLIVDIAVAGNYELKFYVTTYDVNLTATASLSSGVVVGAANGDYVSKSVEKYEYTIDFTTVGADTLTLDIIKSGGMSFIVAQEAFSLKATSE